MYIGPPGHTLGVMKQGAVTILLAFFALVGCAAPPAWQPGDGALVFYAPEDRAWGLAQVACERWSMTGLKCERSPGDWGDVIWRMGAVICPSGRDCTATTEYEWRPGDWRYETTLHDVAGVEAVATHELGHLLGIWNHLDDKLALMHHTTSVESPTTADLDALAEAWGHAPWEE